MVAKAQFAEGGIVVKPDSVRSVAKHAASTGSPLLVVDRWRLIPSRPRAAARDVLGGRLLRVIRRFVLRARAPGGRGGQRLSRGHEALLRSRSIDLAGLERASGRTFR